MSRIFCSRARAVVNAKPPFVLLSAQAAAVWSDNSSLRASCSHFSAVWLPFSWGGRHFKGFLRFVRNLCCTLAQSVWTLWPWRSHSLLRCSRELSLVLLPP